MGFIVFMLGVAIFVFLFVPALGRILGWGATAAVVIDAMATSRPRAPSPATPPETKPERCPGETSYEFRERLAAGRREQERAKNFDPQDMSTFPGATADERWENYNAYRRKVLGQAHDE